MAELGTSIFNIFTPTSPADVNFIERPAINDHLVDALRTPGRQVIVYGESGSGKTTLVLKVLQRLYPTHIVSRCTRDTTFRELVRDAFDQLGQFYVDELGAGGKRGRKVGVGFDFTAVKGSLDLSDDQEDSEKSKRMLPPELTGQRLGECLGAAGACWVIEDLHKTAPEVKGSLAQTLKVFSDLSADYPDVRAIVIGAVLSPREVLQFDREMRNRLAEIHVPLMSSREIADIFLNGGRLANIHYELAILDRLVTLSNGMPSIAHHLGLNCALSLGIEVVSDISGTVSTPIFDNAVQRYLSGCSDSLKALLDAALQPGVDPTMADGPRIIVGVLARAEIEGISCESLLRAVRETLPGYPQAALDEDLRKLCETAEGEVVLLTTEGRYRFTDPMFRAFAQGSLGLWEDPAQGVSLKMIMNSLRANWARPGQTLEVTGDDGLTYVVRF